MIHKQISDGLGRGENRGGKKACTWKNVSGSTRGRFVFDGFFSLALGYRPPEGEGREGVRTTEGGDEKREDAGGGPKAPTSHLIVVKGERGGENSLISGGGRI